ncbi:MAG: hypothetical protein ACI8W7_001059 [Gammaproteobacteria bacterium]|jgi:hypothetical protein
MFSARRKTSWAVPRDHGFASVTGANLRGALG